MKGDLWFRRVDGDLRERNKRIDTKDIQATADAIPGCDAIWMEGLGDFPMSEKSARIAKCLRPALERVSDWKKTD